MSGMLPRVESGMLQGRKYKGRNKVGRKREEKQRMEGREIKGRKSSDLKGEHIFLLSDPEYNNKGLSTGWVNVLYGGVISKVLTCCTLVGTCRPAGVCQTSIVHMCIVHSAPRHVDQPKGTEPILSNDHPKCNNYIKAIFFLDHCARLTSTKETRSVR